MDYLRKQASDAAAAAQSAAEQAQARTQANLSAAAQAAQAAAKSTAQYSSTLTGGSAAAAPMEDARDRRRVPAARLVTQVVRGVPLHSALHCSPS